MRKIDATDLRSELTDALNRVGFAGERVVVQRNGRPLAAMVSMQDLAKLEKIDRSKK